MSAKVLAAGLVLLVSVPTADAKKWIWDEVAPTVLAATESPVDGEAGAELVFHRTWINQTMFPKFSHRREHRVRKKIYSAAAADEHGLVKLHRVTGTRILEVHARTVKPDGRELEVPASEIYERVVADDGVTALSAVSFAFPSVEPGVVLDYCWTELTDGALEIMMPLRFQEELPAREISYFLGGLGSTRMGLRVHTLNAELDIAQWKSYMRLTHANVPALVDEPLSPPWGDHVPWSLAFYALGELPEAEAHWTAQAGELNAQASALLVSPKGLKAAAATAVAAARTPEELVSSLAASARRLLRPAGGASTWSALSVPRRPGADHDSTKAILKRGEGSRTDLLLVFVDLARSAGLDVRLGLAEDRSVASFDREVPNVFFLPRLVACVREGEVWRVVEPTSGLLPADMLPWELEGASVLLASAAGHEFITSARSGASQSRRRCRGELALTAAGDLSGRLELEFTGHRAMGLRKAMLKDETPAAAALAHLETLVVDAAWTEVAVDGLDEPEGALIVSAQLELSGHAEVTGKRLFVPPVLLSRDAEPPLTPGPRVNRIQFPHAWLDLDVYSLSLPEGMALEGTAAPTVLKAPKLAKHDLRVEREQDGTLAVHRTFAFGLGGSLSFEASAAPLLAELFAGVHAADSEAFTLLRGGAGAVGAP